MKDRAGNELNIGDRVLYLKPGTSTSWLVWGEVVRFTPKKVVVKCLSGAAYEVGNEYTREPRSIVKPYEAK